MIQSLSCSSFLASLPCSLTLSFLCLLYLSLLRCCLPFLPVSFLTMCLSGWLAGWLGFVLAFVALLWLVPARPPDTALSCKLANATGCTQRSFDLKAAQLQQHRAQVLSAVASWPPPKKPTSHEIATNATKSTKITKSHKSQGHHKLYA